MSRMKDFRIFIAEWYMDKNKGLIDIDKAFVLADDLWDRAAHKDKKATILLGKLTKMYQNT